MDANLIPIVAIIMGTLCFLVPVSLVTLRFAIKPIAEAVAQMRSSGASEQEISLLGQRLALLEQIVGGMETDVQRRSEAQDFQNELLSSPDQA